MELSLGSIAYVQQYVTLSCGGDGISHLSPTGSVSMLSNSDSLLDSGAVKSEIDGYEKLFAGARETTGKITTDESIEKRKKEYKRMVDAFYNLVTDFYTFGWVRLHHVVHSSCPFL